MNADIIILLWIPFALLHVVRCYDGYTSCSKPFRNSKTWSDLPCDLKNENWCALPGAGYPWHAVRRFVYENHGLMKRMYGEQRHFSVLRAEIDSDDLNVINDGWHGYNEGSFKKYEKPTSTILRQTFGPMPSSSSTTTTTTTTTTSTSTTSAIPNSTATITTTKSSTTDNTTAFYVSLNIEDENLTTTDNVYETTISEEFLSSISSTTASSSTSKADASKMSEPQIFQETTTDESNVRLKGVNACPVKEEIVAPFWANNTKGEILALLNLYPFEQYVHWERCSHEHKQMYCRQGCRCEQQYRLHRLLAYDPTNDCRGIFSDWFKFPSCCVCKCYDIITEFRQTSRSPRGSKEAKQFPPYFPPYFPLGWND